VSGDVACVLEKITMRFHMLLSVCGGMSPEASANREQTQVSIRGKAEDRPPKLRSCDGNNGGLKFITSGTDGLFMSRESIVLATAQMMAWNSENTESQHDIHFMLSASPSQTDTSRAVLCCLLWVRACMHILTARLYEHRMHER
jgi:hypothetical protein